MRHPLKTIFCLPVTVVLLFTGCNNPEPQEADPVRRKSPVAIAKFLRGSGDTYLKITYGQPYKRDRVVFGNIVPYDEVWRTGANEATEITATKDIIFAGEPLEAGTYALFTIPRRDEEWTIILNSRLGQWGAFDYSEEHDILRTKVSAAKLSSTSEALTIQFEETGDDSADIVMRWDRTEVRIPIVFPPGDSAAGS